ncbi:YihY/virulence factor BrkB family protein [Ectobacillus ponti]|uniref:YihY/virulence factor BrkB family protein n=1 Tax=Ectobacillus ponti TaxID=2961894 RepID=A0AA42BQH6_9BACI|nr:YihY/virulence factor BrkB family protein [Ectobacillus ponti]MCP8969897.1 YihY/virulence factor BrkB family protein [Ectobacillus ponti]
MISAERRSRMFKFLKDLYVRTKDDDLSGLGSQLAYFFLLSLFPALVFLMTLIAYLPIHTHDVLGFVRAYAPAEALDLIETNLHKVLDDHSNGGLLSFGIIATLWSASNGINAVMSAFNRAYDTKETRSIFVTRGLSILLTIAMVFVIIFALALPVFGKVIGEAVFRVLHLSGMFVYVWKIVRLLISFFVLLLVFAFVYQFAPNKRLRPKEVISGAIFATVGWIAVSYGFAFYVENFGNYSNTYGSLGGIIVLMFWFYLTAWVILLGGEINALLNCYRTHGRDSRHKA